jgi:hypothetical protein
MIMGITESRATAVSAAGEFFASGEQCHRHRRSGLGALATILVLPALLGVMGCLEMPAPVGDPEKSRIDPRVSGVWLQIENDSASLLWVFEPYDKRTWLIRWAELEERTSDEDEVLENIPPGDPDEASDDELTALHLLRANRFQVNGVAFFKGWRKRISGRSFVTMEFKGMLGSETGMESGIWWVAKAELIDPDHLELKFVNNDFDEIEEDMTQSQLERIVRRNIDDPELFITEVFGGVLERVPQEDFDIVAGMIEDAGVMSTYD